MIGLTRVLSLLSLGCCLALPSPAQQVGVTSAAVGEPRGTPPAQNERILRVGIWMGVERLERIAKLFARAGRRARGDLRQQEEKINILINLHMQNQELFARNEERFARNEERFAKNEERFAKQDENIQALLEFQKRTDEIFRQNEERFARTDEIFRQNEERFARTDEIFRQNEERFARTDERFVELAESQANSDRRLNSLIDIIREDRNGTS